MVCYGIFCSGQFSAVLEARTFLSQLHFVGWEKQTFGLQLFVKAAFVEERSKDGINRFFFRFSLTVSSAPEEGFKGKGLSVL